MASICRGTGKGHKWVQWTDEAGKRQTLRLGRCNQRQAEKHLTVVESLLSYRIAQLPVDSEIARFVGSLEGQLRKRYEALGLVAEREQAKNQMTLKTYLDNYYGAKQGKETSHTVWSHTRKRLVEYFGADRPIADITPVEARAFRLWLASSNKRDKAKTLEDGTVVPPAPLSQNTIRKRIGIAKEVFNAAFLDGLVTRNPFANAGPVAVRGNKERLFYIDLDTFNKVLDAAPNARWRCLLSLARIGAVRVPSEVYGLCWSDVSWEAKRITIRSPKTEHHEGRDTRILPLFPRLEDELLKLFLEPTEGDRLFGGLSAGSNLRTQLLKIITRAGVEPWPRLWQNMRASGATDLARQLPAHVAASICGHTVEVAREHYWQTTDSDLNLVISTLHPKQNPKQQVPATESKQTSRSEGEAVLTEECCFSQGKQQDQWTTLDSNQ